MAKRTTEEHPSTENTPAGKFPQYPRFFSATLFRKAFRPLTAALLWLLIGSLIMLNIAFTNTEVFRGIAKRLGMEQYASSLLSHVFNVLGASSSQPTEEEQKPSNLRADYARWEKIAAEYPDYRDAHYILATLAFQLGDNAAAKTHLEEVRSLDPNYPGIAKLEALMGSQ